MTAAVEKVMRENQAPGAIVGVWWSGDGQFVKAFGLADTVSGRKMSTADLWKIASITKTFTAEVVLQLVSEGKVGLDQRLSSFSFSQGLANADRITVRQLLNHTSGYPDLENDDKDFQILRFGEPTRIWTHEEILGWGRTLKPLSQPGEIYHYTNFGYYLLGLIIEETTGNTAADEIEARCAQKLGLSNTRLSDMPDYILSKPHSEGYCVRSGLPDGIILPGDEEVMDAIGWNTTAGWTSAGVVSGLADLKKWIEAVAKGTQLSPEMYFAQLETVPITDQPNGPGYGLGVVLMQTGLGEFHFHNGATLGYSSYAASLADNSITIVVFVNIMPTAKGNTTPATDIATALFGILQDKAAK